MDIEKAQLTDDSQPALASVSSISVFALHVRRSVRNTALLNAELGKQITFKDTLICADERDVNHKTTH